MSVTVSNREKATFHVFPTLHVLHVIHVIWSGSWWIDVEPFWHVWCFACILVVAGRYFEHVELWWVQRFPRDAQKPRQLDCSWWRFGQSSRQKARLCTAHKSIWINQHTNTHSRSFSSVKLRHRRCWCGRHRWEQRHGQFLQSLPSCILHLSTPAVSKADLKRSNLIQWPRTLKGVMHKMFLKYNQHQLAD